MMDRFLRLASIALIVAGVAACDDETEVPQGETSTVTVSVFIDDPNNSDGDGDDPIAGALVTLTPTDEGEAAITATTNAEGIATFENVPAGVYTLTHQPATPITNAVLTGTEERTLVAQFEGGTTTAEFIYSYDPGSITIQFFRDENDNDTYEAADDTTLAGFQAILFAGTDTSASALESITVDSTGLGVFEDIAQGTYTIVILPIVGAEVADSVLEVTVTAEQNTDVLVEFTGGEAIATIAQARALAPGSSVTVEGVVSAGTGVYSSTNFYIQDATAGISVFIGSGGPSIDVALGDSVRVTGTVGAFSQEIQIGGGAAMAVEILGDGTIPTPEVVTAADILAGQFQGELVTVTGLTVDSVGPYFSGTNFNVFAIQGTDTLVVFFDGDAGIQREQIIEGGIYSVTGIGTRFNSTLEIKPRSAADVVLTSNPGGTLPIATARLLPNGEVVTVTGVVTAGPAPDTVFSSSSFYVQDNTGGINVFCGGTGGTSCLTIGAGDSVTVTGTTGTFSAEEQLAGSAGQALVITEHGAGTLPTPIDIDAADVNAARFQGRLATADSVEVVSISGTGGNVTVVVADNAGEFAVFLDTDTGLTGAMFTVGSSYSLTGILASFDPSGDPPPVYQLKPRGAADVTAL